MLLKTLAREVGDTGSWTKGLEVETRFLIDSVKIDSTAFDLQDGSGLSAGNLVTPRAFVQLLSYMYRHPKRASFIAGLPRAQQRGSLLRRFAGTAVEGRVLAKTGSISRVNTLSGYIEKTDGRVITFSIQANAHDIANRQMLAQIDSVVVQLAR
jgi:D-alanyl-D-alanine carboxypeptidase/D-alanyl-D-alanine-endopeptidase (penicillin-binding protein 4)